MAYLSLILLNICLIVMTCYLTFDTKFEHFILFLIGIRQIRLLLLTEGL